MKYHGRELGKILIAEGLCPPNAYHVTLMVPADGAVVLHYDVFVDTDDIPKIVRALTALIQPKSETPS